VNALTGAALGAGTKLLIDKITGKPVAKTDAPVSKQPKISNNTGTPANSNSAKVAAANAAAKKAQEARAKADAEKLTSKVLTDEEVQAELDRVKASEEAFGPPEGAIKNADGTYYVIDGNTKITYNADGTTAGMEEAGEVLAKDSLSEGEEIVTDSTTGGTGGTRGLGGNNENVVENTTEYYQDEDGNRYTMNAGGSYDLAFYADGSPVEVADVGDDLVGGVDTDFAENTWTDPDSGEVWNLSDSGMWTLEGDDSTYYDDSLYADNAENTENEDYLYAGNEDDTNYYDYGYSGEEFAKRGGLITMMKKGGGVRNFAVGGADGEFDDFMNLSDSSAQVLVYGPDGTVYANPTQAHNAGVFDYTFTPRMANYYSTDESGNLLKNDQLYRAAEEPQDEYTTDSLGNTFKTLPDGTTVFYRAAEVPEDITSAGGGNRNWYDDYVRPVVSGGQRLASDALEGISGALGTTAGAAGAGALIATLLGQDFGGGTGNQNQGLDMSQVGVINPRTTDFGIGPTRFVGYEDYGTSGDEYTPNEELLRNLNAPNYNPVNEGDYGYEEVAAEEEAPKMASGGLSSMATPVASYYTFGQPADILANLGMRAQPPMNSPDMMAQVGQQQQPQQAQQQGLPQQMPPQMAQQVPQGMPQQGMMPQQQGMPPPMRKGGLPHVSNVPLVEGRMDFRRGSAVHGAGDGQSDDIPAMLADGEYVIDSETVAQIGNGSTKAGAQALDKFRESIRAHKRSAPINKIPPKTKALTSYLKGAR